MPDIGNIVQVSAKNLGRNNKELFVDIPDAGEGVIFGEWSKGQPDRSQRFYAKIQSKGQDGKFKLTMKDVEQRPGWWSLESSFFPMNTNPNEAMIDERLITEFAPKVAEESSKNRPEFFIYPNSRLNINGLRNFYDAFKRIETQIAQGKSSDERNAIFARQRPLIKIMKARVAHSQTKSTQPIPGTFALFLNRCIDNIVRLEDFHAFMLLFEAVAGWHSFFSKQSSS